MMRAARYALVITLVSVTIEAIVAHRAHLATWRIYVVGADGMPVRDTWLVEAPR